LDKKRNANLSQGAVGLNSLHINYFFLRIHVYFEYALQDGGETIFNEAGSSKSQGTERFT
jgi:hypothetical protein